MIMYTTKNGARVYNIMVRGYHDYKNVWSAPIDGTELSCEIEPGRLLPQRMKVFQDRHRVRFCLVNLW